MMRNLTILAAIVFLIAGAVFWRGGESAETDANGTRTIADATGRSVTLPKRPQRVVVLNASNLDLFCAAGGASKVVGKPASAALSAKVRAETAHAREVGVIHSPNLETILQLKPDLVLGVDVPFHNALIPTLEKAGIPIVIQPLDRVEQVIDSLRLYGELNGSEEIAAAAAADVEKEYRGALARAEGRAAPKSLIVWGASSSFSMATSASFAGDMLKRLGAENIADRADAEGGFVPLSMEYIAQADPEAIFLIAHGQDPETGSRFLDELAADSVWKELKAVKNGRVYALSAELFAVNPGTRIGEAMRVMSNDLYAEDAS